MSARVVAVFAMAAVMGVVAGCSRSEATSSKPAAPSVERGKYIVEGVGMCADCHTVRDEKGQFRMDRWLMGGDLDIKPVHEMPVWAPTVPAIAGLPSMTDEQAVTFLTTGILPSGQPPRPPMPAYRLNRQDARDVVAYLRSLARRPR